jgi:two-component system cell cycle response regulator DivK
VDPQDSIRCFVPTPLRPFPLQEDPAISKATIQIVEDSPEISQVLADAFRFADFAVLQAYTAVEALQFAAERQPGLIFMEIRLPDLDGLSVAQTLKQDPATRHIPIVAMTAYEVSGKQARLIGQLCVGHCQKPFSSRDAINLATAILKLPGEPPTRPQRPPPTRIEDR